MVSQDAGAFAFRALIGSIILFGVYIGTFFLLNHVGLLTIDINLFLNQFGAPFVAATVLWQFVQVGFGALIE